jgi:ABC-type multidrug transport system permease subunit
MNKKKIALIIFASFFIAGILILTVVLGTLFPHIKTVQWIFGGIGVLFTIAGGIGSFVLIKKTIKALKDNQNTSK